MNNKFSRLTEFVETLEVEELTNEQEFMLLVGASGGSGSDGGNNCRCNNTDNCKCWGDNCNC